MSGEQSIKKPKLTPTQAKVVKAKMKAELTDTPQGKVALEVYPNQTPGSAAVSMTRELKNANVQEALAIAMAEAGLTVDSLAGVVSDAMVATKTVIIRDRSASQEEADNSAFADEVPDHGIRLKAAGMAANWLGVGKGEAGGNGTTNNFFIGVAKADKGEYGV